MTNKNKTKRSQNMAKLQQELAALKMAKSKSKTRGKKSTPFRDVGGIIGSAAGKMLGAPQLASVGRWLGTGIGGIFGSGDYQIVGSPNYNVLNGQTPKFSSTHATNIVCHREYLGDLTGTSAFTNTSYPLNPGLSQTFPWLSAIAANYQQYKFHGLVFEFRSLITDFVASGSPGVVVLTTNYNADQPAFISRQEAENAEFATAVKPTLNLMHMIECKPDETANKLYNVRTGNVPTGQDLRLYDYGLTQLITQANPSIDLGEVWVSYCVEFFKPVLDQENSSLEVVSSHIAKNGVTSAAPLGTVSLYQSGLLSVTSGPTAYQINNAQVGVTYLINFNIFAATSTVAGNIAYTNANAVNLYKYDTVGSYYTGSGSPNFYQVFALTPIINGPIVIAFTGYVITGGAQIDIITTILDPTTTT